MSEEQTATEGATQEVATENTGSDNHQQNASTGPEKTPDWYEKELTKTRNEAANYRTKLRTTEEKLAAAKSPEDFEAAKQELAAENKKLARDLLVERVGRELPDDLRELLKGDTEEELKAHAEKLKKFAPETKVVTPTPRKLGGGLDGNSGGGKDFDPAEVAKQYRLGRL